MHAPESASARRLVGGLGSLRFEESWEKEFRRSFSSRDLPLVRAALTAGLIFVAIPFVMDANLYSREIASRSALIRFGLMAPALALALLSTTSGVLAGYVSRLLLCAGAALSAGSAGLVLLSVSYGADIDIWGAVASIV